MATRREASARGRPAPRLYLMTQVAADAADGARTLASATEAADAAAVLLRVAGADERERIKAIKACAEPVQALGIAVLLEGHAELVARAGADGVHASGVALFRAALEQMKPERIVGAGGLTSRHDSMLAAEAGADYVMFGEPDDQGVRPGFDALLDRVAWWSELFEVPAVAYAAHLDEVASLVTSGADFIALAPEIWTGAEGLSAIAEARQHLTRREVV